jgi:hypothetical protein
MGYLTTITLHNDAMHEFVKDPEGLVKSIQEGMHEAQRTHKAAYPPFVGKSGGSYGGYIEVQPSRHADDHTIYIHSGNCVFNLNPWNEDFKTLVRHYPKLALDLIKRAESILKEAKRVYKEKNNKTA